METTGEKGDSVTLSDELLLRPDLYDYCPASNLAFNEAINARIRNGEEIYHFGFGQSPFPPMPEMIAALRDQSHQTSYLPVAGIPDLRNEIVKFHARHDGFDAEEDDVVVGPGSKELIYLLLTVFCGDVMLLSPSWTTYSPQVRLSGHQPIIVNTSLQTGWTVRPADLERVLSEFRNTRRPEKLADSEYKLLILCNPDNPTGASYQAQELKALGQFCRENKILVLSDEIYGRLHFDSGHESLAKYFREGTIVSSGFSKWPSVGGWRVGYHIYPKELKALRKAVTSAASHTYSCCPAPMQFAIAQTLKNTSICDKYIKHVTRILQTLGEFCYRELQSVGVLCTKPSAGYYIFPDFEICRKSFRKRGIETCQDMCETLLKETKVAVMAGGPAFLRPVDEFTVRLCYVNFKGADGLEFSYKTGLSTPLPADFVEKYAPLTYKGILELKKWVQLHREEET